MSRCARRAVEIADDGEAFDSLRAPEPDSFAPLWGGSGRRSLSLSLG